MIRKNTVPFTDPSATHSTRSNSTPTDLLACIRETAGKFFKDVEGSHDWEHTLRVHRLCRRIGPLEGADMVVLEAAAYLHDIGRPAQDEARGALCHAVHGARMAEEILQPLDLEPSRKDNIVHSIRTHRFRDDALPQTIEARVLFDADKLDAIGAVGIARAFQFAGELGASLHNPYLAPEQTESYSRNDTGYREYVVKLARIKDRMLTINGRKAAMARDAFMTTFFDRFLKEYAGEL
jgi:uncharacterized protein